MTALPKLFLLTPLLVLSAPATQAQVLLIDTVEQAAAVIPEGSARPARGITDERVVREFGEPLERHPPVGEPPIIRWDYPQYTVYFEGRHVLHSVAKRPVP